LPAGGKPVPVQQTKISQQQKQRCSASTQQPSRIANRHRQKTTFNARSYCRLLPHRQGLLQV
jgi:hypothetical protein